MPLYLCSTTSKYRLIFYQKRRLSSIKSLSVSSLRLLHLLLPSLFLPSFSFFLQFALPPFFFSPFSRSSLQNPSSFFFFFQTPFPFFPFSPTSFPFLAPFSFPFFLFSFFLYLPSIFGSPHFPLCSLSSKKKTPPSNNYFFPFFSFSHFFLFF